MKSGNYNQNSEMPLLKQRGFFLPVIGVILLILIIGVGVSVYYFWINKNKQSAQQETVVQTSPLPSIAQSNKKQYITNKLNGFPVYPDASFIARQFQPPCVKDRFTGFSTCDSTTYSWSSKDDYDQISAWYKEDKSGSGWKCSGGAGTYDGPRSAGGKTSCKKDVLNYGLFLSANNTQTTIELQIPNKNEIQDPTTPEAVTQSFYDWYLSCLNNHFKDPIDQTPHTSCPYEGSFYISSELLQNIKGNVGKDPILCAQNTPTAITIDKAVIKDKTATVEIHEKFNKEQIIRAELKQDIGLWQLTSIICR